jgi:hypothetical protein
MNSLSEHPFWIWRFPNARTTTIGNTLMTNPINNQPEQPTKQATEADDLETDSLLLLDVDLNGLWPGSVGGSIPRVFIEIRHTPQSV